MQINQAIKEKTLVITGGTGSFGSTVLKHFLSTDIGEIRIFSRDEKKQDWMRHSLQAQYPECSSKVKFFIKAYIRQCVPGWVTRRLLGSELKQLQNVVDMSRQLTNILKAGNLPQVALMGGYAVSNPNVYNGFEKKFAGVWNVGVMVRIPVWNWGDVAYKVRASKGATTIANLELAEAREKIELQVNQSVFRVEEANKKLEMAMANTRKADENLRMANVGFSEGVISPTTVMEAQTAWLQAQSEKIDAEIDVRLSQVNLQKSMGTLEY